MIPLFVEVEISTSLVSLVTIVMAGVPATTVILNAVGADTIGVSPVFVNVAVARTVTAPFLVFLK